MRGVFAQTSTARQQRPNITLTLPSPCLNLTGSQSVLHGDLLQRSPCQSDYLFLPFLFRSPPSTATVTWWWTTFLINWPLRYPEHFCWDCPTKTPSFKKLIRRSGSPSRSVEHNQTHSLHEHTKLSMSPPGQSG